MSAKERWLRWRWRRIDWNLLAFRVAMASLFLLAITLGLWIGEGRP